MSAISENQNLHPENQAAPRTPACGTTRQVSILLVVRHPVGGIRTFLRYVFLRFPPQKYRLTLIAPQCSELDQLRQDLDAYFLDVIPIERHTSFPAFLGTVTRFIVRTRFDLVYSHGFTSGLASAIGCRLTRTPHLTTCHDVFTDDQFTGIQGLLTKVILAASLAMIDRVHCVTSDARDNLLAYLPLTRLFRNRLVVIRNGIDTNRFADPAVRDFRSELALERDCFLIGFLGRFMSQKGFRYLVDALELLQRQGTVSRRPVILTVSPQDAFYREEMAEIERRGLSASVFFLPFAANVAPTLKGLDILAVPSLWEAGPLLPMEALVAGVPVVGSTCVGLREILRDTPARVVPMRDAPALAKAIMDEMQSPTTQQAREFAPVASERFNVVKQAEALEKLIDELAMRGHARRPKHRSVSERQRDER